MEIIHYLALTAAEMLRVPELPPHAAYMACHFSPSGTGLSNMPRELPPRSLLIVNDAQPFHGHDPERIARELRELSQMLSLSGVLLDFERPGVDGETALAALLPQTLSCPVCATPGYAAPGCAVLAPPVPPDQSVREYLSKWEGKTVWLETAPSAVQITLRPDGAERTALTRAEPLPDDHTDPRLCCRYRVRLTPDSAEFTLLRTAAELPRLLQSAESSGVAVAVGLYQQWERAGQRD